MAAKGKANNLLQRSQLGQQVTAQSASGSSAAMPTDLAPVVQTPPATYGNLTCEPYYAGGVCQDILQVYPYVVTNLSRSDQLITRLIVDQIIQTLYDFMATPECLREAIPLLCRYSFPTCDPAFGIPVYQPICRRGCEIVRDYLCVEPWQKMVQLVNILNLSVIDQPDCGPLKYVNGGDAPMCIDTLDGGVIPQPINTGATCYSGRGRGYNGTLNVTLSGYSCQSWNSTSPHQHLLYLGDYPELQGGHNFCRNPGERGERPWCFTTNRDTRWEYCNVPMCPRGPTCMIYTDGVCKAYGLIGMDQIYTNTTVGSQAGYEAAMATLFTSVENFEPQCKSLFKEFVCIANFPSCDLSHSTPRPLQVCRSYCERVRTMCANDLNALQSFFRVVDIDPIVIPNCSMLPEPNAGQAPECFLPSTVPDFLTYGTTTCYNATNQGQTYHGSLNVTETGRTCQHWDFQAPHVHPLTPLFRRYLEGHNQCRNPEGRGERPWCYTTDSNTRWEYCDVSVCAQTVVGNVDSSTDYLRIALPVAIGVLLLLVIVVVIVTIVCYRKDKVSRKKNIPKEIDGERYSQGPVHIVNLHTPITVKESANPLYALNPLAVQGPVEYDGVKLPEYPRDDIFYIRDLGQGQFGVVVQAEVKNIEPGVQQSTVAVKVLKEGASVKMKREFFREATLMHTFNHPNILKLYGVCIDQEPLCMIFEFMELGDLNNFLRQNAPGKWGSHPSLSRSGHLRPGQPGLDIQQLVCISIDIASGLEYLAQNHFVHRDLATRNCLVDSSLRVKISDFGLSQDIYSTDYFRLGDSELLPIRWMPPESIMYSKFTIQSDIWSFGVVLWEIYSFGMQPYYSLSNEEVVQHVRDGNVMTCPDGCPQELYDLMLDCWAMNAEDRPKAGEIHNGLLRWSPDLSASLQQQHQVKHPNYQNMATIREYAKQTSDRSEGGPFVPDMSDDGTMYPFQPQERQHTSKRSLNSSSDAPLLAPTSPDGTISPLQALEVEQSSQKLLNGGSELLAPTSPDETASPQPSEVQTSEQSLNGSTDALLSPPVSPDGTIPPLQAVEVEQSSQKLPNGGSEFTVLAPTSPDETASPQPLEVQAFEQSLNGSTDALLSPPVSPDGTISPPQPVNMQQTSEQLQSSDAPPEGTVPPLQTSKQVSTNIDDPAALITPATSNGAKSSVIEGDSQESASYMFGSPTREIAPNIYEHSV